MKKVEEIANKYGYQILNLNLVGSPEVLYSRYIYRMNHENRHPVHLVNKLDKYDSFKEYMGKRKSEYLCGEVIEINTDDFSYQSNEELLNNIKQFLLR